MSKKMYHEYMEALSDKRFVELYQISFPFVELDSEGNIKKDTNGKSIILSEKEDIRIKAEKAYNDLKTEKNPESVAQTYDVSNFSQYLNGYVGGFSDEINSAIINLKNTEYTNIIETDKAYIILYMSNRNDDDAKNAYALSLTRENIDKKCESEKQKILSKVNVSNEDIIEWKNIDKKLLVENLSMFK